MKNLEVELQRVQSIQRKLSLTFAVIGKSDQMQHPKLYNSVSDIVDIVLRGAFLKKEQLEKEIKDLEAEKKQNVSSARKDKLRKKLREKYIILSSYEQLSNLALSGKPDSRY